MDSEDSLGFGFTPDAPIDNNAVQPPPPPNPYSLQSSRQGQSERVDTQTIGSPNGQANVANGNMDPNANANSDLKNNVQTAKEAKSKCCRCFHNFTSSEWWQKFFDLDIKQFGMRCGFVFYFWSKKFYTSLGKYGDLWGPIWIPVSMMIILATCQIFGSTISQQIIDINLIIGYAIGLVVYQILIPGILYLIIRCSGERYIIRYTHLLCIYGYSQIVYLPLGLFLLIPSKINNDEVTMQAIVGVLWAVLTVFSVLFILFTLFGTLKKVFFKKSYWIITVVFGLLHAGMAVANLMCVVLNGRI